MVKDQTVPRRSRLAEMASKDPSCYTAPLMATALVEMGDADAATEETVYALGHIARGLLLKSGVFPLSRPELAEQVKGLGYSRLAELHEELRYPSKARLSRLRMAQRYSKKLLVPRLLGSVVKKAFQKLDRRLRQELLSMDGATVLTRKGVVLTAGAIVRVPGGSTGGGRRAAAMQLSKLGLAIKISADGPITGFRKKKAIFSL